MNNIMASILFLLLIIIIIGIDTIFSTNKKILSVLIWAIKAPIILFEYFAMFWFWGGDGTYMLVAIPVCFIVLFLLHNYLMKKYNNKSKIKKSLISSRVLLTPILSVLITYLIAKIVGIQVAIQ